MPSVVVVLPASTIGLAIACVWLLFPTTAALPSTSVRGALRLPWRGNERQVSSIGAMFSDRHPTDQHQLRIALFITSHGSLHHESFMECMPQILRKSPGLSQADVILYMGTHDTLAVARFRKLLDRWPCGNKSMHVGSNPGYQKGAMLAAHMGFSQGWFDGYDWVIRVNPDVLIHDESKLLSLMGDPGNWGVFADCTNHMCKDHSGCRGRIHTDFFAVRPEHVDKDAFKNWNRAPSAERQANVAFSNIIEARREAWIWGNHIDGACRIRGGGIWHDQSRLCEDVRQQEPWSKR